MIDLQKAKKIFKEFVQTYDKKQDGIESKIKHTYGVIKECEDLAQYLGLKEEERKLAMLIGLLHDIGRFRQLEEYQNSEDYKNFDHADYAVWLLQKDNFIRDFIDETGYDTIILKAIKNHNKYEIEKGLTEQELLYAKIIRDADKLDNFKLKETQSIKELFHISEEQLRKTRNYTRSL